MRIAMLIPSSWHDSHQRSGACRHLVETLTEGLVDRGVEVTPAVNQEPHPQQKIYRQNPLDNHPVDYADRRAEDFLRLSELFHQADEFDLIHSHCDFAPLTFSEFTDTPILTTLFGLPSEAELSVFRKYEKTSRFVSACRAIRSPSLNYMGNVYPGIEPDRYVLNESPQSYFAWLGPIHSKAGADEALEIARRTGTDLCLAGPIVDAAYFENEIEPGLDGTRYRYVGLPNSDERERLLGEAQALLRPVSLDQSFPFHVLESNACGTPVVAYSSGVMREIVENGVNGFLVSGLTEATEALGSINSLSRGNCRQLVLKRFNGQRMVDEYLKLYRRLLDATEREDHRPWGHYQVLADLPDHKVKRIVVYPGKRLSLQRHSRRVEHWTIVAGAPILTLNDREQQLKVGDSADIPLGAVHRVFNPGEEDVVFIEVQLGDYFGEDDIERFEDDFGRI